MPNTKSAIKRARKEKQSNLVNRQKASILNTFKRKFNDSITSGDVDKARQSAITLQSIIDSQASGGYIPKNRAARLVSKMNITLKKLVVSN